MRRLVLTTLLAAALGAPAPAAAQGEAPQRGRDKLAERVSAECRRAGVTDDASCWTGIGKRVVRAEVDAHQGSWLQRTLAFQRELGDGLAFRDAPWLSTHNSYNSPHERPTLSHTDSNQQLSNVDQLRLDIRSLEIDVHWFPSPEGGGMAPVVCHGTGPVGCSTERLLSDHLAELRGWLDANPREVVLLYLEDQIGAAGYETTARVVRDGLGGRLYAPQGSGCQNLPLDLTRDAIRAAGKQVIIVGSCGSGSWQGVSHAWPGSVRFEDRARDWTCSKAPRDGRLVRYYEDSTFLSQTPASSPDDGLTPETVRAMVACGVEILGFDQLLPHDGRLEATVWSWAEGEPSGGRAAVQRGDGRWDAVSASGRRPAACRTTDGSWLLTGPVPVSSAARACAQAGATFALPRTGEQNAQLQAAGGEGAWLALPHAHGTGPRH